MNDTISLTEAAEQLGVHYMTVYRWVRTGRLPAHKRGAQWQVDPADLAAVTSDPDQPDAAGDNHAGPAAGPRARCRQLEQRLLAGDEAGAWTIVEDALTYGSEPTDIHLELLLPAMRSIGERWERGDVTVADEHTASAVGLRLVGRLGPQFARRGRKRGSVVTGSVTGDPHSLSVAVAVDLLRGAGYAVTDLGANTPAASYAHAAHTQRLAAVIVAVVHSECGGNLGDIVTAVRAVSPVPVIAGGPGIGESDAAAAGALHVARLDDLVATVDRLRDEARASGR